MSSLMRLIPETKSPTEKPKGGSIMKETWETVMAKEMNGRTGNLSALWKVINSASAYFGYFTFGGGTEKFRRGRHILGIQ